MHAYACICIYIYACICMYMQVSYTYIVCTVYIHMKSYRECERVPSLEILVLEQKAPSHACDQAFEEHLAKAYGEGKQSVDCSHRHLHWVLAGTLKKTWQAKVTQLVGHIEI